MPRMKKKSDAGRLVWSSEHGRICSTCRKPQAQCRCAGAKKLAPRQESDGIVRVRREKKGRGGKVATTITGLPGDEAALKAIAKKLKQRCGVGGSVKDWVVVIQGDRVDDVVAALSADGHTVKKAGG